MSSLGIILIYYQVFPEKEISAPLEPLRDTGKIIFFDLYFEKVNRLEINLVSRHNKCKIYE